LERVGNSLFKLLPEFWQEGVFVKKSHKSCKCGRGACRTGNHAAPNEHVPGVSVLFYLKLLWLSLTQRKLTKAVNATASFIPQCRVHNHENLPSEGSFVLACNKYVPGTVMQALCAALTGMSMARPAMVDDMLIVVGNDSSKRLNWFARLFKAVANWVFARWHHNLVIVEMSPEKTTLAGLRDWRRRASKQPVFVFPEGRGSGHSLTVRPGAGRWLRGLGVPIIPTGVWYQNGCWHVRFGQPITLSSGNEDVALGQAMAQILPADFPRVHHAPMAKHVVGQQADLGCVVPGAGASAS
jgi:hypothetical protein